VLKPSLTYIVPSQKVCDYWTITFQNLVLSTSGSNGTGRWLNFISFAPPIGANAESGPSSAPANDSSNRENHLHYNPYPKTAAPGQGEVCEAGNEKYASGQTVIGNASSLWGTTTRGQVEK
jgi:hypothetical protein